MKLGSEQLLEIGDRLFESEIEKGHAVFLFSYTPQEGVTPTYRLEGLTHEQLFTLTTIARRTIDEVEKAYYDKIAQQYVQTQDDGEEEDE